MRVIAGSAKHLPLKTVDGMGTRPTTDRIKETLFNMLQNDIYDCRFLDLFAGSGAIGIEALSRGAKKAVFVEQNKKAAACIRQNLEFTRLTENAEVLNMEVFAALGRLQGAEPFDIIFMDPPYDHLWEKKVLEALKDSAIADERTLLIAEISDKTDYSYIDMMGYELVKCKNYKTNAHIFVRKKV